MSDLQFVPTPTGKPCRVLIEGGEPVAVVYDLPTGRHPAMTHQVLHNNPKVMLNVHKAPVDTRTGYVIDRKGLRELAAVYDEIEAHRKDTREANAAFIQWIHGTLIPFLDDMDAKLALEKAGLLPAPPMTAELRITIGGIKFETGALDVDKDTIGMTINGAKWTMTVRQFVSTIDKGNTEGILAALLA